MNLPEPGFLFALTNPGSESTLKLEVAMAGLDWRPGYQRRGFVTFKAAPGSEFREDSLKAPLACARRICMSVGKFASEEDALAVIRRRAGKEAVIHQARYQDRKMQGVAGVPARPGQWVGTIVGLGPDEFWAGIHLQTPFMSPDPAGDPMLEMPAHSPSRAWLKLEEAVRFFGLSFGAKDIVVEVGASPGGVVLALLDRGAAVIGVDPAQMAEVVMERAVPSRAAGPAGGGWFYHCRKPAALIARRDLGSDVTWFMSDMNQSPEVVLKECARMMKMCPTIRGALLTLKLTDLAEVKRKDHWFTVMEGLGFQMIRMQQFSAHHREFALLGMR